MVITEKVELLINPENLNRLEELGYEIPRYYNKNKRRMVFKRGTSIIVNVCDLPPSSHVKVEVQCEYCGERKEIAYRDYTKSLKSNEFIKKYACDNCDHLKKREVIEYKQSKCLLLNTEKGYYTFRQNRLKALDDYIKKYGTTVGMQTNKEGASLFCIINQYGDNIKQCCIDLGYDIADVTKKIKPEGYYDDFNNLKNEIEKLYLQLNRFPKQIEVLKGLHICNEKLLKFGGIKKIKELMGYNNSNDLIDDRGFSNRSTYEYMVAQYLIHNDVSYKREQNPFKAKHSRYKSDFTFYKNDGSEVHVEIWGFVKNVYNHPREKSYNEKRILKEELYRKNNYTLISIEYDLFKKSYEDIQNCLYDIFKDYLNLDLQPVSNTLLIPPTKMSDEDLLTEIMKYSDDPNVFPYQKVLTENNVSLLYLETIKRYGSYYNFANLYNKFTHYQYKKWDSRSIFEVFQYMLTKYNHILKIDELKLYNKHDKNIVGIIESSKKIFGSYIDARLQFYLYCIKNEISVSKSDISYLYDLANIKRGFNKKTATIDRQTKAQFIISNINSKEEL